MFLPLFIRYWNDPEVLQKLGQAMGVSASGEIGTSADVSGPEEGDEDEAEYEDESILHHAASTGDVEVFLVYVHIWRYAPLCVHTLFEFI